MTVAEQTITDDELSELLAFEGDLALHAAVDPFKMRTLLTELQHRREAEAGRLTPADVEWVVNDIAELGVKIGNQFFFLYKGRSLVYGWLDPDPTQPPLHDEGGPMHWRPVFKREFGECVHPINYADLTKIGTVSLDDSEDWQQLPAAKLAASPSSPASGVRVKALEWREYSLKHDYGSGSWEANETGVVYEILDVGSDGKHGARYYWRGRGQFDTLAEAQAAAQADYEARILSAIGEHP